MRTTTQTAAGLLGLALLSPMTTASAAAETCRGEAATIVGTGPTITGTEGRDVVVTNGATDIDTLGGDDLVCVVPSSGDEWVPTRVDVDAGPGDDVVDTSAGRPTPGVFTVVLGVGADTYVGGGGQDEVTTGNRTDLVDDDTDTVRTGDFYDRVITGAQNGASHDVVDTGSDSDVIQLTSTSFGADAVLAAGEGDDVLQVEIASGDVSFDMAPGVMRTTAGNATFSSVDEVALNTHSNGTVTYAGTRSDDVLGIHPRGATPTLDVATKGGADEIVIEPADISAASRIEAGSGRDELVAASHTGRLALHLKKDQLEIDDTSVVADSMEHALLMAPQVKLVGDRADNLLGYVGCEATMRGGAGRDELYGTSDNDFHRYRFDCLETATMNGGSGADRLFGGPGADRLSGGSGRDSLRGRNSSDVLRGGKGHDTLYGHADDDDLRGGKGPDRLWGHGGEDDLRGGMDDDRLWGGGEDDDLRGNMGNDRLLAGKGHDRADGGPGRRDRCRAAERVRRCER
ncbi:calcium-binding protein [Nocardioides seonyuensis]|nr:calcium-binding protein [Nocardioides seonyuensis]